MIIEKNFEPVLQRGHGDPERAHRHRLTQPDLANVVVAYVCKHAGPQSILGCHEIHQSKFVS